MPGTGYENNISMREKRMVGKKPDTNLNENVKDNSGKLKNASLVSDEFQAY